MAFSHRGQTGQRRDELGRSGQPPLVLGRCLHADAAGFPRRSLQLVDAQQNRQVSPLQGLYLIL